MGNRLDVALVALIVAAVGVPFFVSHHLKLGPNAKSPQTVTVILGGKVVVAGGRAKIWFGGGSSGTECEVSCSGETRTFEPGLKEPFQACGITAELQEVKETSPPKAVFKVSWEE